MRVARLVALAAALLSAALVLAPGALADPPGTCTMGVPYDGGLTVSVDGVAQTKTATGVYGPYAVSLCRVTAETSTYNVSVNRVGGGGDQADLEASDLDASFRLAFTPQAGDTPLTAELKGRGDSFAIDPYDANRVTITARPIGFADIWSCTDPPLQCAIEHPIASAYHAANLSGAVRYMTADGTGGAGFTDLPGLVTSSGAYVFFVWASCPTNPRRDQSYSGLKIDLGGPHFRADGTTPNVGSVAAFIPAAAVASCFGASPQAYAASARITRTEGGVTRTATEGATADDGLHYVLDATDAGVTISIPEVTFSQPTYRFGTKRGRSLARGTRTAVALARALHVTKTASQRFALTSRSRGVCAAGGAALYGFARGTCRYTLTVRSATGRKVKAKRGSFRVR